MYTCMYACMCDCLWSTVAIIHVILKNKKHPPLTLCNTDLKWLKLVLLIQDRGDFYFFFLILKGGGGQGWDFFFFLLGKQGP